MTQAEIAALQVRIATLSSLAVRGAALEASVTENAGAFELKVVPSPGAVAAVAKGS